MSLNMAPRPSKETMGGKDIRTKNQVLLDKRVIGFDVSKKQLLDKADNDQKFEDSSKFQRQQD